MLPLLPLLLAAAPTADDARLLTSIIAAAVAEDGRVDVVTKEDLRKAVSLQAERDAVGCSAESCLADVAAALGASVVLFGSVGTFGDELLLELAAFDADAAQSQGRSVVRAKALAELSTKAEEKAKALRAAALEKAGPGKKLRVLVLDLELRNAPAQQTQEQQEQAPASPPPSPLFLGGIGAGAAGILAAAVGVGADLYAVSLVNSANATGDDGGFVVKSAADANRLYADAGTYGAVAVVGYVAAGVCLAASGALIFLSSSE